MVLEGGTTLKSNYLLPPFLVLCLQAKSSAIKHVWLSFVRSKQETQLKLSPVEAVCSPCRSWERGRVPSSLEQQPAETLEGSLGAQLVPSGSPAGFLSTFKRKNASPPSQPLPGKVTPGELTRSFTSVGAGWQLALLDALAK